MKEYINDLIWELDEKIIDINYEIAKKRYNITTFTTQEVKDVYSREIIILENKIKILESVKTFLLEKFNQNK